MGYFPLSRFVWLIQVKKSNLDHLHRILGFILLFYGRKQVDVVLKKTSINLRKGNKEIEVPITHLSQVFFKKLKQGYYCIFRFEPPTKFGTQIEFHTMVSEEVLKGLQYIANKNHTNNES